MKKKEKKIKYLMLKKMKMNFLSILNLKNMRKKIIWKIRQKKKIIQTKT